MNAIEFYKGLDKKKKIIFWVAVAFIFLSILKVSLWRVKSKRIPTEKKIFKQIYLPDKKKKIEGIYAIGKLKKERYLPEIEKIFKRTTDPDIKRVSAWTIGVIDINKLKSYLDSQNNEEKRIIIETLLKIDKDNIDFLVDRFSKEDKDTKLYIMDFMEKEKYADKLMDISENTEEEKDIREKALSLLEKVGKSEYEPRLWNLYYNDPEEEIQKAAYKTIKAIEKRGKRCSSVLKNL